MTPGERFLAHRLREELEWLRRHSQHEVSEAVALAYLQDQCGFEAEGCRYATSEYCRLDCPFRPEDLP